MGNNESTKLTAFGRRIRTLIGRAGYRSRAEFCQESGIPPMALYRWETGVHLPQTANLRALAAALRVSIDELTDDGSLSAEPHSPYASLVPWLDASEMARRLRDGAVVSPEVSSRALDLIASYRGTLGDPGLAAWDSLAARAVVLAASEVRPSAAASPTRPRRNSSR